MLLILLQIGCVSHVPQKNLILFGTYQGKLIALDSSSLRIAAETRIEKHAVTGVGRYLNGLNE